MFLLTNFRRQRGHVQSGRSAPLGLFGLLTPTSSLPNNALFYSLHHQLAAISKHT